MVFTPRTGVKDEDNKVVNMKLPGLVAKMAGVEIEEYVSMPIDEDSEVQFGLPNLEEEFTGSVWADILTPTTAKPIARYSQDYFADQTAATMNAFGSGKVIYLGTFGDQKFYQDVTKWFLEVAGIKSLLPGIPEGVEISERWQGDQRLIFMLNHTADPKEINLDSEYTDLLHAKSIFGTIILKPYEVLILSDR